MNFNERVYGVCKRIPKGRVCTYGEIARFLDCKAYRAVGNAMNKNPHWPIVPCHRVVKSDGNVGGFASGVRNKIKLLKKEGIKIKDNRIIDFDKVLFKLR